MSEECKLPKGWAYTTIGDLCQISVGFAFKSEEFVQDGIRLLRGENIEPGALRWNDTRYWPHEKSGPHQHLLISEGDIILAMDRPVVSAGLKLARALASDLPSLLVQRVARIRPKADLCCSFVFLGMQSSDFVRHLLKGQTGTQLPHINTKSISAYAMPLAPLTQQHRIVAKIEELFSDLDAGVAALKRAKANLKRYRAAVLKAAVEGDLTAEWRAQHPDTEPASQLLTRILKQRREKWEADQLTKFQAAGKEPPKGWRDKYVEPTPPMTNGLPTLPKGWCWASVEQLCEVGTGTTPSRTNPRFYDGGTIPWVLSTAVNQPFIDGADEFVTEAAIAETTLRRYPAGTLLIALYGEGKTRGMVSELRIEATINQALGALVFSGSAVQIRPFIKQFLASAYHQLRRQAAGGMQPNLNLGIVKQIAVPLPPVDEQVEAVREVAEKVSQIDAAEAAIERDLLRASRLRQSILQRAFTGQLVPQDPTDEPASTLLDRLRAGPSAENGNTPTATPVGRRGPRTKKTSQKGSAAE